MLLIISPGLNTAIPVSDVSNDPEDLRFHYPVVEMTHSQPAAKKIVYREQVCVSSELLDLFFTCLCL